MYIARQPIFDRAMQLYGYELLFRSSDYSTTYGQTSSVAATATVLSGLFEIGVKELVGRHKAFINFDENTLYSDAIELIGPDSLVVEILEYTQLSDKVLERLNYLKQKDYRIALDDFTESVENYPAVPLANIIKFDLIETPLATLGESVKSALRLKKILLAEKIETREEFMEAKKMGFHLFQGFFFSRPSIIGSTHTLRADISTYQRILTEISKSEPSFTVIADIISNDVNMAYRLMKVSSNKYNDKQSILLALTKIGLVELERWINILMLQSLSDKKACELIRTSMVRSKFGELLARNTKYSKRKTDISLMCLFSTLDAILDTDMEHALDGILLSTSVKQALIHKSGLFQPIYDIVLASETMNIPIIDQNARLLNLESDRVSDFYIQSLQWADSNMLKM
ncbi:MAG: EAL and HDOD domain-containing protein [Lachnospiraceae bacterium]